MRSEAKRRADRKREARRQAEGYYHSEAYRAKRKRPASRERERDRSRERYTSDPDFRARKLAVNRRSNKKRYAEKRVDLPTDLIRAHVRLVLDDDLIAARDAAGSSPR